MNSATIAFNNEDYLDEALDFIRTTLRDMKISKSNVSRTELLAEETIVLLKRYGAGDEKLSIKISKFFGDVSIELKCQGEEFDPTSGNDGEENEDTIRSLILKAYGEKCKYSHKNKTNKVRILVVKSERHSLYLTLFALFLGIVAGSMFDGLLPEAVVDTCCDISLRPIKDMFMSAIRIIIAPVVFFSLISCIAQFKNLAELGRLAVKIMAVYMITTVVATLLGLAVAKAIPVGEFGFALSSDAMVVSTDFQVDTDVEISLVNTIVNIVPSNFVKPFVESDTLQIMFLAILVGIALGMLGEYSNILKEFCDACNSLFLTVTTIITKFIPIAVFCSVTIMIVDLGGGALTTLVQAGLVEILTIFLMICFYGVLVLVFGRVNPFRFFDNIKEGMLTSLTLASSSAAMPTNMQICKNKLGISSKVCNFSIPLGATVNMDGTCIFLTSFTMFLARAYGVTIDSSSLFSVIFVIILLSLAAPGVPGASIVCLGVVLIQIGVPMEAMGMIIAIDPIIDMFDTMNNTTGDMTATLLVAKSENLLDMETFNKK